MDKKRRMTWNIHGNRGYAEFLQAVRVVGGVVMIWILYMYERVSLFE